MNIFRGIYYLMWAGAIGFAFSGVRRVCASKCEFCSHRLNRHRLCFDSNWTPWHRCHDCDCQIGL